MFKSASFLWVLVVLFVVWFCDFVFGIMRVELFGLRNGVWLLLWAVLCLCTLGFGFCGFCVLGCFRVVVNSVALFCIYGDALICLFHFNFEGFRCLLVVLGCICLLRFVYLWLTCWCWFSYCVFVFDWFVCLCVCGVCMICDVTCFPLRLLGVLFCFNVCFCWVYC